MNEAAFLRAEVHQVRDDRDRLQSQAQALTTDLVKYKESAEKYGAELDILTIRSSELEVDFPVLLTMFVHFFFKIYIMAFTLKMKHCEMLGFFYRQLVRHKITN